MIWKAIPGLAAFEASNEGHIRRIAIGKNGHRPRLLKETFVKKTGYLTVTASMGLSKPACFLVHRLVCLAFHGLPPSADMQVAHGDANRINNRPENLRWATPKENGEDKVRHGNSLYGERHPSVKLTADEVIAVCDLYASGMKQRDIASVFGVHQAQVHRITRRKCWGHLVIPPDIQKRLDLRNRQHAAETAGPLLTRGAA